jgi:hypothetical protein
MLNITQPRKTARRASRIEALGVDRAVSGTQTGKVWPKCTSASMTIKVCTKCSLTKNLLEFEANNRTRSGYGSRCNTCARIYFAEYERKNAIRIKDRQSKKYLRNRQAVLEKLALKRKDPVLNGKILKNKEEYRKQNREALRKAARIRSVKPEVLKRRNEVHKLRKISDPTYSLACTVRRRLTKIFRELGLPKNTCFPDYIGCSKEHFYLHIQRQFSPGMNWKNRSDWDIDHIIPVSWAKTPDGIIRLSHFTNLRPLWKKENERKKNKMPWDLDSSINRESFLMRNEWLIGL